LERRRGCAEGGEGGREGAVEVWDQDVPEVGKEGGGVGLGAAYEKDSKGDCNCVEVDLEWLVVDCEGDLECCAQDGVAAAYGVRSDHYILVQFDVEGYLEWLLRLTAGYLHHISEDTVVLVRKFWEDFLQDHEDSLWYPWPSHLVGYFWGWFRGPLRAEEDLGYTAKSRWFICKCLV